MKDELLTSSQTNANAMLGDVELSDIELKWLNRMKEYMSRHNSFDYICSWWLRLEYEHEGITTTKINYILSKLVKKGVLKKKTSRSWTKFYFNIA